MSNIAIKVFQFYELHDPFSIDFWQRGLFSSAFLGEEVLFLTTRPVLVTALRWKTPFFDDETFSRRHFQPKNSIF
jgi:hypothetical protein